MTIAKQYDNRIIERYYNNSQYLTQSSLNLIEVCVIKSVYYLPCNLYPNRAALHCYEI